MAAAVALLRGLISGSTAAAAAAASSKKQQQQQQQDDVYVYLRLLFPLLHEAMTDIAKAVAATIAHRRPPISDVQLRRQTLNHKP